MYTLADMRILRQVSLRPVVVLWCLGLAVILTSTAALGLWSSRKVVVYLILVICGLTVWLRWGLPWLSKKVLEPRRLAEGALALTAGYAILNFALATYSIQHLARIKGDFGVFLQSLWWTQHGLPLFNTMDGTSHLGVHSSFILLALAPFYSLWSSPLVLALAQAVGQAVGGWIFWRIVRRHLDELTSLILLAAFLLYPAFQYNFGDFYESSLATPMVLLAVDTGMRGRTVPFVLSSLLLLTVKETFPLVLLALGAYLILNGKRKTGLLSLLVGGLGFYMALYVIIPWFRSHYAVFPTDFDHFAPFSRFGDTPLTIILNLTAHPLDALSIAGQQDKLLYLLMLAAPYLWIGLGGSLLWMVCLPELVITLLSNHGFVGGPLLAGARFATTICASFGLSAALSIQRMSTRWNNHPSQVQQLFVSVMLFSALSLVPLWANTTALQPVMGPTELETIMSRIGPDAAVAVPYAIVAPFAQRAIVFDIDRNPPEVIRDCAQYVVTRIDEPQTHLLGLMSAAGFRQIWIGHQFKVLQSPMTPTCDPHTGPWIR